jgi:hypothetical protein
LIGAKGNIFGAILGTVVGFDGWLVFVLFELGKFRYV